MSELDAIKMAAKDAVSIIASTAAEALRVVTYASTEAAKANCASSGTDHDLLIRLETKMGGIKDDIKDLKDGTARYINEHEIRINSLESSKIKQVTLLSIGIAILSVLASLLIYHMFKP